MPIVKASPTIAFSLAHPRTFYYSTCSLQMMADAGIPTPRFYVAETVPQATQAAKDLGGSDCVLKAQVSQIIN